MDTGFPEGVTSQLIGDFRTTRHYEEGIVGIVGQVKGIGEDPLFKEVQENYKLKAETIRNRQERRSLRRQASIKTNVRDEAEKLITAIKKSKKEDIESITHFLTNKLRNDAEIEEPFDVVKLIAEAILELGSKTKLRGELGESILRIYNGYMHLALEEDAKYGQTTLILKMREKGLTITEISQLTGLSEPQITELLG